MSTISILSLILTSNFTQLSSIRLFFPCSSCTWPKNHANMLYIEHAYARVCIPSKRPAHNNRPRLFQLLHTVSVQYTGLSLPCICIMHNYCLKRRWEGLKHPPSLHRPVYILDKCLRVAYNITALLGKFLWYYVIIMSWGKHDIFITLYPRNVRVDFLNRWWICHKI